MRIEQIDTDEIVVLTCPTTGHRILWNDEDIADVVPGTVVAAVVSSLCPEQCAVENLPLAEEWNQHYASVRARKMSLDEAVRGFPAAGKALKVARGGIACGTVTDVVYYMVPEDLPESIFLLAGGDAEKAGS